MAAEKQEKISSLVRPWFENVLKDTGFEPEADEKHTTALLREQLLWHTALSGSASAIEFGREQFAGWLQGKTVHPDIMKSVLQIAAYDGDAQTFTSLDARFVQSQIEHERMNILMALGCFKEKAPLENHSGYRAGPQSVYSGCGNGLESICHPAIVGLVCGKPKTNRAISPDAV
jgi:tricorn protease interacting factor F2/3